MRRPSHNDVTPEIVLDDEMELARVVPIRTETTLTRYPIHQISKKGTVKIKHTKKDSRGKTITTWEVKNPPGPLAYKLDTIIINRRIDEMRNRGEIQRLIKLGSLRDICKELGINPNGKATNSIKEALKENAFAGITAKLNYKGSGGSDLSFEFATTRYTVIFTGETLPNENRADAVYIELHPRYHEMLKHSKTRPLDYGYLRELPPSAQRLYELLSFIMFGALKHKRPNAQMLYSEFCQTAPLTRYEEWDRVRPQMWKIHRPHIDAGYIKSVEFEKTTTAEGVIDWIMKYTPGRKARHEFREFTTKRIEQQYQPQLLKPSNPRTDHAGISESSLSDEQKRLMDGLIANGVTEKKARELVERFTDGVRRELEAWTHRDKSRIKSPAAWLIRAIESGDYSLPSEVKSRRAGKVETEDQKAREELRAKFLGAYHEYLGQELESFRENNSQAYEVFCVEFGHYWTAIAGSVSEDQRDLMRLHFFEHSAEESPQLGILGFWQWAETGITG